MYHTIDFRILKLLVILTVTELKKKTVQIDVYTNFFENGLSYKSPNC